MGHTTQLKQGSLNGLRRQTNECLDSAYNKGYEDGKKDFEVSNEQTEYNKGYNEGLEEFEKLYINEYDYKDFFKSYDNEDIQNWELYDLVAKYGAKKILDDFKMWQEEKKKAEKEIRVGDEVITIGNSKAVVTRIKDNCVRVMFKDGSGFREQHTISELKKTGRHFDEVEQLLDKLRGEDNDNN